MGFVSGFIGVIVQPLQNAAAQIRQLSSVQDEANSRLRLQAQALTINSFGGNGSNAFMTMVEKQYSFVQGITDELSNTAKIFDDVAYVIKSAAEVADMALGGPLMDLAENVLNKLSPDIVVRQGESAVSAIMDDMRQTFHELLHQSGSIFGDVVHGHFNEALHDTTGALGGLAHLVGDIFALLDVVETILGRWAGEVMEALNVLNNRLESVLFFIEDKLFGFSDIDENTAILVDPNSTGIEKGIAAASITITAVGDVMLFIPGAEEGKIAAEEAEEAERLAAEEIERLAAEEIETQVEEQLELTLEKKIETQVEEQLELNLESKEVSAVEMLFPEKEEGLFTKGLSISGNILNGDIISPVFHTVLEQNAKEITAWAVNKGLIMRFGEEGAKPLLEAELTRTLARIAKDKMLDFSSQWVGGPYKQFVMGQINEVELEQKSRELVNQIYSQ
jgi:hypothetical protein